MAKKRRGRAEKVKLKLRKTEIISNEKARGRIGGRVVCVIYDVPSMFDEEEDASLPDNMLVLFKENEKLKIIIIPNDNFRNAILFENIPKDVVRWMKKEEKIQSEFLQTLWGGWSLPTIVKRSPHNRNIMYA